MRTPECAMIRCTTVGIFGLSLLLAGCSDTSASNSSPDPEQSCTLANPLSFPTSPLLGELVVGSLAVKVRKCSTEVSGPATLDLPHGRRLANYFCKGQSLISQLVTPPQTAGSTPHMSVETAVDFLNFDSAMNSAVCSDNQITPNEIPSIP